MKKNNFRTFIISRTDSIGDVMLTLPVAAVLKKEFPGCRVLFLGKAYTAQVIRCCENVDQFLDWDEICSLPAEKQISFMKEKGADVIIHAYPRSAIANLAKKAGIHMRIGASGRLYHWFTCNGIVLLTRRRSNLHEAQLNIKLLRGIIPNTDYTLDEIPEMYGFKPKMSLPSEFKQMIRSDKFNLILHPKSKGSAREWGLNNFISLINILPDDKFRIFITGTADEGKMIFSENGLKLKGKITDLTGKLQLGELITFIDLADGLIAASTGPLHIAAALNKIAIGIYPPMRPINPGRWAPLGIKASYFVKSGSCSLCRKSGTCSCMTSIEPQAVLQRLLKHLS